MGSGSANGQSLGSSDCPPSGSLSFPVLQAHWESDSPLGSIEDWGKVSPFGQAGARSGAGCGATGRGEEADRAVGRPGCRAAGGYRNALCVQLRSARLAEPRHHMSRGAGSCHSAAVGAPKLQLRAPRPP